MICYPCFFTVAYEDDDQLLWSPNVLPENEVKDFLHEASLRVVDGKTQATAEGAQVRDNEQVSTVTYLEAEQM